jgi:hypothetical protein
MGLNSAHTLCIFNGIKGENCILKWTPINEFTLEQRQTDSNNQLQCTLDMKDKFEPCHPGLI